MQVLRNSYPVHFVPLLKSVSVKYVKYMKSAYAQFKLFLLNLFKFLYFSEVLKYLVWKKLLEEEMDGLQVVAEEEEVLDLEKPAQKRVQQLQPLTR